MRLANNHGLTADAGTDGKEESDRESSDLEREYLTCGKVGSTRGGRSEEESNITPGIGSEPKRHRSGINSRADGSHALRAFHGHLHSKRWVNWRHGSRPLLVRLTLSGTSERPFCQPGGPILFAGAACSATGEGGKGSGATTGS
jgi:hypothetical protein